MSTNTVESVTLTSKRDNPITVSELLSGNARKTDYILARVAAGASKALARAEFEKAVLAKETHLKDVSAKLVSAQGVKTIRMDKDGNPLSIRLHKAGSKAARVSELATALQAAEAAKAEADKAKAELAALIAGMGAAN